MEKENVNSIREKLIKNTFDEIKNNICATNINSKGISEFIAKHSNKETFRQNNVFFSSNCQNRGVGKLNFSSKKNNEMVHLFGGYGINEMKSLEKNLDKRIKKKIENKYGENRKSAPSIGNYWEIVEKNNLHLSEPVEYKRKLFLESIQSKKTIDKDIKKEIALKSHNYLKKLVNDLKILKWSENDQIYKIYKTINITEKDNKNFNKKREYEIKNPIFYTDILKINDSKRRSYKKYSLNERNEKSFGIADKQDFYEKIDIISEYLSSNNIKKYIYEKQKDFDVECYVEKEETIKKIKSEMSVNDIEIKFHKKMNYQSVN